MATDWLTPARSMLRTAERRRSWKSVPVTPAAAHAVAHEPLHVRPLHLRVVLRRAREVREFLDLGDHDALPEDAIGFQTARKYLDESVALSLRFVAGEVEWGGDHRLRSLRGALSSAQQMREYVSGLCL
jgi:hypothetical protein